MEHGQLAARHSLLIPMPHAQSHGTSRLLEQSVITKKNQRLGKCKTFGIEEALCREGGGGEVGFLKQRCLGQVFSEHFGTHLWLRDASSQDDWQRLAMGA